MRQPGKVLRVGREEKQEPSGQGFGLVQVEPGSRGLTPLAGVQMNLDFQGRRRHTSCQISTCAFSFRVSRCNPELRKQQCHDMRCAQDLGE
jgi:hypothetical protein